MATLLQSASTCFWGELCFASGAGIKCTKTAQSPPTAIVKPPPISDCIFWFFPSRKNRHTFRHMTVPFVAKFKRLNESGPCWPSCTALLLTSAVSNVASEWPTAFGERDLSGCPVHGLLLSSRLANANAIGVATEPRSRRELSDPLLQYARDQ